MESQGMYESWLIILEIPNSRESYIGRIDAIGQGRDL